MKKYDLHVHSNTSIDSLNKPQTILKVAKKIGLDGIAITDHHFSIKGALAVKKLNTNPDFEVIVGQELNTNKCHLLGLYLNEPIKTTNFFEAVDQINDQGGISVVAHPISLISKRLKVRMIDLPKKVDAVEAVNSRELLPLAQYRIEGRSIKAGIAVTGGSDAHFPFEIGEAITVFDGDLKTAIRKRKTSAYGRHITAVFGKIGSGIVPIVKWSSNKIYHNIIKRK